MVSRLSLGCSASCSTRGRRSEYAEPEGVAVRISCSNGVALVKIMKTVHEFAGVSQDD